LADELELIAAAPLVTGRYQTWRRSDGVPCCITLGEPKFWGRRPPLVDLRVLAPWGVFDAPLDEGRRLYRQRLDARADRIVAALARIAAEHPGEQLVLLCFEDVNAGEVCHRRWFAEWFEQRYGVVVPEVGALRAQGAQEPSEPSPRLPGI
jgi:hypothetical protein